MTAATISVPTRATIIILWALRILMAALFVAAGFMKLSSQPQMVTEFGQVGLGQWFRYFTGIIEVTGAIALVIPRVSILGGIALFLVDIGAFVAQIAILHMDWIHTIVIGLILAAIIYLQRNRLLS